MARGQWLEDMAISSGDLYFLQTIDYRSVFDLHISKENLELAHTAAARL